MPPAEAASPAAAVDVDEPAPEVADASSSGDAGVAADAAATDADDAPAEPLDPEAAARALADRYLDLAQRTQADFDNYRKRMTREVRAAEARGIGRLARELLPALDNLERALQAVEAAEPANHLSEGIRLVTAELSAALGRAGIQGFDPTGEPFDPVHHEAVAQQPVEGAQAGTVVQVLAPGYRLNDAVLRPARVIVAS